MPIGLPWQGRSIFYFNLCFCQPANKKATFHFCYSIVIVAVPGDSGGRYVCAGAMVQLALMDKGSLVKLAVPIIAILDDYKFTSRESMMNDEAESGDDAEDLANHWRAGL